MTKKKTVIPVGTGSPFESIRHTNEYGQEYWTARELLKVLEYNEYRFFKAVVIRAMESCKGAEQQVSDHFVQTHETIELPKGASRRLKIISYRGMPAISLFKMPTLPKRR